MNKKYFSDFNFNPKITSEMRITGKFQKYLEWGAKHGVLIGDVTMPAAFGPLGVPGVAALADIPANKAIIAVPFSIIISQERVRASQLGFIFNQFPDLFDAEETLDAEFNILALYIYWQKTLGQASFYAPYFDVVQSGNTMFEWNKSDLLYIEVPMIIEEFVKLKQDMEELWIDILKIILKYPQIFGKADADSKKLFYWSYELVMTRCFGWSLKSTSLVPFADMLNHSNVAATHYVVHSRIEAGISLKCPDRQFHAKKQYRQKNQKIDLSLMKIQQKDLQSIHTYRDYKSAMINKNKVFLQDSLRKEVEANIGQIYDYYSKEEKQKLINRINYNVMRSVPDFHIWDLGFATSSDSEDNDSDEETEEQREKQFEQLREKDQSSLKFFCQQIEQIKKGNHTSTVKFHTTYLDEIKIIQEQKSLDQENLSQQSTQIQDNISIKSSQSENSDKQLPIAIVNLNENTQKAVTIIGIPEQHLKNSLVKQYLMNDYDDDVDMVNLVKQAKEQKKSQDDDEKVEEESSEESEWDWLSENDDEAYFTITTTEPIKKNEQVFVTYGRRTNRFLLVWYGFVIDENKYSSYNFRLWMKMDLSQESYNDSLFKKIVMHKILEKEDFDMKFVEYQGNKIPISEITNEFRLKSKKLSLGFQKYIKILKELIVYLRLFLMVFYKGKENKNLLITVPLSLDYELFVLQFYVGLLDYLINEFSTTIEEDREILQRTDISMPRRFATQFNLENKEILYSQIQICLDAIIIIKKLKSGQLFKDVYMGNDENQVNYNQIIESRRPLKQYLKDLYDNIFKNNLHENLNLLQ